MDPTFSHTATKVVFLVTIGAWALGERYLSCRDLWRGARLKGSQDHGSIWWAAGSVLLAVGGAFGLSTVQALDLPGLDAWVLVGLTIAWLGLALRTWAVRVLGRSFTTVVIVREDQQLISTGPYRWLMHPSYSGLILILTGLGCALDNVGSLLVMLLIPLVGICRRISVEEQVLHERFGEAFEGYAHDRARLVPRLW